MSLKAVGIVAASLVAGLVGLTLLGKTVVEKQLKEEIERQARKAAQPPAAEPVVEVVETLGNWDKGTLSMPKAAEAPAEVVVDVAAVDVEDLDTSNV